LLKYWTALHNDRPGKRRITKWCSTNPTVWTGQPSANAIAFMRCREASWKNTEGNVALERRRQIVRTIIATHGLERSLA